jgi:hypothetical protein
MAADKALAGTKSPKAFRSIALLTSLTPLLATCRGRCGEHLHARQVIISGNLRTLSAMCRRL